MGFWWFQGQWAFERASLAIRPADGLIAAAIYVGTLLLVFVAAVVHSRHEGPVEQGKSVTGWPSIEAIEFLTPRELVLVLHHLSEVGQSYADREACETSARLLRDQLRQIECRPSEQQANLG